MPRKRRTYPRLCRKCGVVKPKEGFYIYDKKAYRESTFCKECSTILRRERYLLSPPSREYERRQWLKRAHGLTLEIFQIMLAAQNGGCAICGTKNPGAYGVFSVDHNHATGELRGLLCSKCNTGLGHFNDDPSLLEMASKYLKGGYLG